MPVLERLSVFPVGSKILEAGCGNGSFAKVLQAKGFVVTGIELEDSGLDYARKLCTGVRFEKISVYDDIASSLEQTFDAVVSLEVVEHLYDPRLFARRVRDCLEPGGLFVLSTPYHGYFKNLLIALSGKSDEHWSPLWDGGHIKFWSRRTITTLLEESGFQVELFIGAGRLPFLWKSMILVASKTSQPS